MFAMATFDVVIDEAGSLEVGVADGGAEKFEASLFHIFRYCVRLGRCYRNICHCHRMVDHRKLSMKERPKIVEETTELFLNLNK